LQGAIGLLVQAEALQVQAAQGLGHVHVVDPVAGLVAQAHRRAALQVTQHRAAGREHQARMVAGAVAQQRQAGVEAAADGDLAMLARRQGLAGFVQDLDIQTRLQQQKALQRVHEHADRADLVHRIQVQHRAAETLLQARAQPAM